MVIVLSESLGRVWRGVLVMLVRIARPSLTDQRLLLIACATRTVLFTLMMLLMHLLLIKVGGLLGVFHSTLLLKLLVAKG